MLILGVTSVMSANALPHMHVLLSKQVILCEFIGSFGGNRHLYPVEPFLVTGRSAGAVTRAQHRSVPATS